MTLRDATRIRFQCPGVTVIDHDSNRGFGAAVNTGFRAARGRFLAALNNDALVSWECLARIMRFLDTHRGASAGAPQILDREGRPQRVGFDIPRTPWRRIVDRRRSGDVLGAPAASSTGHYRAGYLKGACVVFTRRALEEVGLFDEQFHMFAEEIDLFQRLSFAGWTAWVVADADVQATHLAGLSTRNHINPELAERFRLQSYRSMCVYYRKHHAWVTAALMRGLLVARLSGRLLRSFVTGETRWDAPRGPREQLACLVTVLRPCQSRPSEPSLEAPAPGHDGPWTSLR